MIKPINKSFPTSYSNFADVVKDNGVFIDKSLFIKDIIDDSKALLISRPRRFGKSMNLSMLAEYFAIAASKEDIHAPDSLFKNLKIANPEYAPYHQFYGKHPVIYLDLGD